MAKKFSLVLGVVLLLVGIWGLATDGQPHDLIVFGINGIHNWIHILSGVVALLASFGGERYAKMYCWVFGVVYGLVAIAGFLKIGAVVTLLNLNMPDNLLHLVIAVACLWVAAQSKAVAPVTA